MFYWKYRGVDPWTKRTILFLSKSWNASTISPWYIGILIIKIHSCPGSVEVHLQDLPFAAFQDLLSRWLLLRIFQTLIWFIGFANSFLCMMIHCPNPKRNVDRFYWIWLTSKRYFRLNRRFQIILRLTGSEKSSPQGYEITFETLSQKIVSGMEESVTRYLGNKSVANKRSVIDSIQLHMFSGFQIWECSLTPRKQVII